MEASERGVVERELVARLASLLWRLRRATLIETGLFEMQGGALQQQHRDQLSHEATNPALQVFYRLLHEPRVTVSEEPSTRQREASIELNSNVDPSPNARSGQQRKIDTAAAYLRLCRCNPRAMKRLGRYETALWRQVAQTLLILETTRRNSIPISKIVAR